jgi:hypothetical protein
VSAAARAGLIAGGAALIAAIVARVADDPQCMTMGLFSSGTVTGWAGLVWLVSIIAALVLLIIAAVRRGGGWAVPVGFVVLAVAIGYGVSTIIALDSSYKAWCGG